MCPYILLFFNSVSLTVDRGREPDERGAGQAAAGGQRRFLLRGRLEDVRHQVRGMEIMIRKHSSKHFYLSKNPKRI